MALQPARHPLVSQWLNGSMVITNMTEHGGRVIYVDSGSGTDAGGYGYSPDAPVATLNYPFTAGLVRANAGDVIKVLEGHAENLALDSTVDMDIAGVTIEGLGYGADRPTFTCTAVAGDFKLAAASSIIQNLLFLNDVDNSTGLLEMSAADCKILDCEFREADAAKFADIIILTVDGADRCEIAGCKIVGNVGDGAVSLISVDGSDDIHIHDCDLYADCSTSLIDFATTASARVRLHDLTLWNDDATGGADAVQCILDTITTSTGFIGPNIRCFLGVDAANVTGAITGATFVMDAEGIIVVNAAGEAGMIIDWTVSTG